MNLDPESLARLRELARAATPGPWYGDVTPPGPSGSVARNEAIVTADRMHVAHRGFQKSAQWWRDAQYIAAANPAIVLTIIARLRAAEGALMAIHEFANDDGNWEHEEIIADDGMFIGCDGRYTVEAMASDALKGMSDAVPNV